MVQAVKLVRIFHVRSNDIVFRNFEGRGSTYNPPGNRNFCLVLGSEDASQLSEDDWNVKVDGYGRNVVQISIPATVQSEDIEVPTGLEVAKLVVFPYRWVMDKQHGTKAFLVSMNIVSKEQ